MKSQNQKQCFQLFGTELDQAQQLEQGDIWVGDGALLWVPVPSLSHGVVWISSPFLLRRWQSRQPPKQEKTEIPQPYSCNFNQKNKVYLKDAIIQADELKPFKKDETDDKDTDEKDKWKSFVPQQDSSIDKVLVLPDQHCATLIQMSLWRQVKIKLDEHKVVDGGFRYEEAIPPDTLMYFTWGLTNQANGTGQQSENDFQTLIQNHDIIQIGGQESLNGRQEFSEQFNRKDEAF